MSGLPNEAMSPPLIVKSLKPRVASATTVRHHAVIVQTSFRPPIR